MLVKSITDKTVNCIIFTDSQTILHQIKTKDLSKIKNKFYGTKVLRIAKEIEKNHIVVRYIKTKENIADVLTKPLSVRIF